MLKEFINQKFAVAMLKAYGDAEKTKMLLELYESLMKESSTPSQASSLYDR